MDEFHQRGLGVGRHVLARGVEIGVQHSEVHVGATASTAATGTASSGSEHSTVVTARLFAGELALGLGAQGRCAALPCTFGGFAERGAVGLGGSAGGAADGGAAHGLALGAASITFTFHLAHLLGASHAAHGLLAVDFALGTLAL